MRRLSVLLAVLLASTALAQPPRIPAPAPPKEYEIDIRYRIEAFRNERAEQFKDMMSRLAQLEFKRDPDDDLRGDLNNEIENPAMDRLRGTIPATSLPGVLRLRPVLNVLIRPTGKALPMGDLPVRVELELASDLVPARQRLVTEKLAEILRKLQFRQPIGYDHRGYTRLMGSLPASQLETLLRDVRRSPLSWDQLSRSLLNDLRKVPSGPDSLRATLEAWAAHPEGSKLIVSALEAWALTEPGYRMVSELPPLVVNEATLMREIKVAVLKNQGLDKLTQQRMVEVVRTNVVVREQLLGHLGQDRQSGPALDALFAEILKAPPAIASQLMDILLRRLEGREAAVVLPQLFRGRVILRVIEARPDLPLPDPRDPPPQLAPEVLKLGPSLRELLTDAGKAGTPQRMDIILSHVAPNDAATEQALYKAAPSLVIEGRLGQQLSTIFKPSEAIALARMPIVSTIRLPREARSAVLKLPEPAGDEAEVLKSTGLAEVLRQGKPTRPVRVAVIDSDFRGWQPLVRKQLPFSTRLLDLTAERNRSLAGDPFPGPADALGNGTLIALAVAKAAPWCELLLVRIDAGCPHQLRLVHRRMMGNEEFGESLLFRRTEVLTRQQEINHRRNVLLKERLEVLRLFADDQPQNDDQLEKRRQRMAAYLKAQEEFNKEETAVFEYEKAYLGHLTRMRDLRDVRIVVCGLNWHEGLPVDGGSSVVRLLDDAQRPRFLWIQAAGNSRGQAWTGLFRDAENNGAMEFADAKAPLPAGNWNQELAFLAWQPFKGEREGLLPERTRVRITMQWREAHDPNFARDGEDPFRRPLSELRLLVLRQLDPEGKTRPADDLKIEAETPVDAATRLSMPERIAAEEGSAVYEQTLEMTVNTKGRLALRLEGAAARSTRPPDTVELPSSRQSGELRPRIFIETLTEGGRVVFESHAVSRGEVGTPADASRALTVGALDARGKPQPYSTQGTPYNVELSRRPELATFDRLGLEGAKDIGGNAMSAGLLAGYAASLLGHGTRWEEVVDEVRKRLQK